MNTATTKRFLILLSSEWEAKRVGLYQLVSLAEHCYSINDIETLREFSILLQRFPHHFSQIGKYYEAIYLFRRGDFENAATLLENVVETGTSRYRAKALLSLGAIEQSRNNIADSLKLRLEACRLADPATLLDAQSGIAVIRSIEGDHHWASKHLEGMMPLARLLGGLTYVKYLNALAVEFAEVGRLQEAKNISNILIASPYASVFPELNETAQEVSVKAYRLSRSIVSVALKPIPKNVLLMPDREVVPTPQDKPANLRSLQEWKDKMVKEPNGEEDQKDVDAMDSNELLVEILQTTSDRAISEDKLRKIVKSIRRVLTTPTKKP